MADEVSPEVIQSTQKLLGKHVTKPQLTEKLLKKPPFRFLHDVIVVLVRNGFLKGLYTDAELNSENVKERDAKITFLNKLITAVKSLSGKDLQAKSSKIIAGLDAAETNRLLQTIAKLIDDKVDTKEYVKNLKKPPKDAKKPAEAQESAKDATNLKKTTSKTSLAKSTDKLDSTRKKTEKKPVRKGSDDASPKVKDSLTAAAKTKVDLKKKPVKPEKAEKTPSRTSGTSVGSKDSKTSKVSKPSIPKASPKEKISPKAASSSSTPKTSTKTSPKDDHNDEGEKELEKQVAIEEEVPEVQEEEKPIKVVEASPREDSWKPQVINEEVVVIPDKPPSYQEAEKQEDADSVVVAASKPLKPSSAMKQNQNVDSVDVDNAPAVRQPSARPKSARPRSGSSDQRAPSAQIKSDAKNEIKPEIPAQSTSNNNNNIKKPEMKPVMAVRDFSMKSAAKERDISSSIMRNKENTIPEAESAKEIATPFRPKSSMLRPPSVRPSSARPGAPRLRPESSIPMKEVIPLGKINVIVENFDAKDTHNEEDEEETVVIQSMPDETPPENNFTEKSLNLDIPADKGHLVEQILEQMQDGGQGDKAQLEWEHEGSKSKDATTKEINALRASIQALTKTANPLGKLASYLHEDVEAMHSELQTWLNMKRQYTTEIAKQKRVNNESNQPLLQQLRNLEEGVKHERDEIATIKYNIWRNEERIRHLVSKQIAID